MLGEVGHGGPRAPWGPQSANRQALCGRRWTPQVRTWHTGLVPKTLQLCAQLSGQHRKQGRKDREGGAKAPRAWDNLWPPLSLSHCLSAAVGACPGVCTPYAN